MINQNCAKILERPINTCAMGCKTETCCSVTKQGGFYHRCIIQLSKKQNCNIDSGHICGSCKKTF